MGLSSRPALAVVLLLMSAAPLHAGTVRVGILKDSDINQWLCDSSASREKLPGDFRFASTKFQKCSSGDSVVVVNDSNVSVKIDLEFSGTGFSYEMHGGGIGLAFYKCDSPSGAAKRTMLVKDPCGGLLSPNRSCTEDIQFCPERSGTSRGKLKVTVGEGSKARTTIFDLIGDAIYSPELQAADEARRRHLDELMKIPHVAKVDLDPRDHDIFIDVEVDEDGNLDRIQRAIPPKIEGYDVEVTRYMPVAVGL